MGVVGATHTFVLSLQTNKSRDEQLNIFYYNTDFLRDSQSGASGWLRWVLRAIDSILCVCDWVLLGIFAGEEPILDWRDLALSYKDPEVPLYFV
jgi:hypothetical protein